MRSRAAEHRWPEANASFGLQVASDVDYARGAHAWRVGLLLEAGRYHTNNRSNYLGTFTFASLDDYLAGRPASYTRRFGDAEVRFGNRQVGAYLQDDFRLARSVLISYGMRFEGQSLASHSVNLLPRAGLTWSPFRTGSSTLRGRLGTLRGLDFRRRVRTKSGRGRAPSTRHSRSEPRISRSRIERRCWPARAVSFCRRYGTANKRRYERRAGATSDARLQAVRHI